MRTFILIVSAASLAMPLASAAHAQPNSIRHDRSTVGYTLQSVRMRAGPDTDYPVVRTIPRNRRVDVHGCLRDWNWCDIGYSNDRGWVAGDYLGADYRGRRQPIVRVGPSLSLGILTFIFGNYWDNHYRGRPFYADRPRWERHYYDKHRPQWGSRPAPPPAMQRPDRHEDNQHHQGTQRSNMQRPGVSSRAGPDAPHPNAGTRTNDHAN